MQRCMAEGRAVPDEIVFSLLELPISLAAAGRNVVIEGFPASLVHAVVLSVVVLSVVLVVVVLSVVVAPGSA